MVNGCKGIVYRLVAFKEPVINSPVFRVWPADGIHLHAGLRSLGKAFKPAQTNRCQHSRAKGGIVYFCLFQLQIQYICHDLPPKLPLRTATDDPHPGHFHALLL